MCENNLSLSLNTLTARVIIVEIHVDIDSSDHLPLSTHNYDVTFFPYSPSSAITFQCSLEPVV